MTLRDFLLLVAAVVVGMILYSYLSVPAGFFAEFLVKWWGVRTEMLLRIIDAATFAIVAMTVGALLVLVTAPLANEPHRLALYLAIALPLVYLIRITVSLTFFHSLQEAIVMTVRIFAVVGLAFAAGCLLADRLLLRAHSKPR